MSKKKQRNAFFYFMLDMQQELKQQGRNVPMAQMSILAGPRWSVSYVIDHAQPSPYHRYVLMYTAKLLSNSYP